MKQIVKEGNYKTYFVQSRTHHKGIPIANNLELPGSRGIHKKYQMIGIIRLG